MKPSHAAALALVSWVLVIPPELSASKHDYMMEDFADGFANGDWKVVYRYKNAEECANGLNFLLSHDEKLANYAARTKQRREKVADELKAGGFCVREDDPRLKQPPPIQPPL
jgi:hypothetical protein